MAEPGQRSDGAQKHERQELFERPEPPEAFFILDEGALRREVGGPKVMARQIDHLIEMAQRPRVSIQIVRFSAGAHSAMAGPFVHLEFPADNDPDVIFVENTLGDTLFRDDEEITASYRVADEWHTSSASGGGECVEVRFAVERVQIRDSKNRHGALLAFTQDEWRAFLIGVRIGEFDVPEAPD